MAIDTPRLPSGPPQRAAEDPRATAVRVVEARVAFVRRTADPHGAAIQRLLRDLGERDVLLATRLRGRRACRLPSAPRSPGSRKPTSGLSLANDESEVLLPADRSGNCPTTTLFFTWPIRTFM